MRLAALVFSAALMTTSISSIASAQESAKGNPSSSPQASSASNTSTTAPSPTPTPTPAPNPTGKMPTHADDVTIPPLPNAWSYFVFVQGVENGSGVGLGFETPKTWDVLSGRFSLISDRYRDRTPADRDLDFLTAQAAMKIYLAPRASRGFGSYVVAALNHHFTREDTDGSRTGVDFLFGIELNQLVADNTLSQVATQGAFVELGSTYAGMTSEPSGVRLRDGFIARLGFKTYF